MIKSEKFSNGSRNQLTIKVSVKRKWHNIIIIVMFIFQLLYYKL